MNEATCFSKSLPHEKTEVRSFFTYDAITPMS